MKVNNEKYFRFLSHKLQNKILIWGVMVTMTASITPILNLLQKNVLNMLAEKKAFDFVLFIIILFVILEMVSEILDNINVYFGTKIFYIFNNELLSKVNKKISKIKMEEYESPEIYDLINRVQTGIEENSFAGIGGIIAIVSAFITIIGNVIIMFTINIYIPLIIVISSIPYIWAVFKQGQDRYKLTEKINSYSRKEEYLNNVLTNRENAKDVRFFSATTFLVEKAEEIRNKIFLNKKILNSKLLARAIETNLFRNLSFCIVLLLLGYSGIRKNSIKVGDVLFIINTIQSLISTITAFTVNVTSLNNLYYFSKDFRRLMEINEEKSTKSNIKGYEIEFKNVYYKYPQSKKYALSDISFKIKENEKIAIVGENGSGKTTLINLLLGIYEPTKGKILIDGVDASESLEDIRSKISCVFQNFNKYQMSIEDNIYVGNSEAKKSLEKKHITDFFDKFPQKGKTMLGQIYSDGIDLSGGQWQQLAIMRALSREGCKVIILDEPTASLDPTIENKIYEDLVKNFSDKSLILITHRLSAVSICDRVMVLDEGKIIENGTHEYLMKRKEKYYQMYTSQKELYKG